MMSQCCGNLRLLIFLLFCGYLRIAAGLERQTQSLAQSFALRRGMPVAAIGQHRIRCGARPAMFAGDVDVLQGVDEHGPVVALPTGDHDRQRPSLPINGVVDLRGQPAAGTSDPMPGRLKLASPGFLVIRQSPLCPAQGGRYWCRAGEHG